ncbi:MAG: phenylalanine--tRNA ligase subunit alpha [Candidatus Marsarchaeota archaeon]|nr:phenylalanine--tRNA ligase subunit alpha [Candidatus Marsarchaeota archaeon]
MSAGVTETEAMVLKALGGGGEFSLDDLCEATRLPVASVSSAVEGLWSKGLLQRSESKLYEVRLTERGEKLGKLPEDVLYEYVGEGVPIDAAKTGSGLSPDDFKAGVAWGLRRGMLRLTTSDSGRILTKSAQKRDLSEAFDKLREKGRLVFDEVPHEYMDLKARQIVEVREASSVRVRLAQGVSVHEVLKTRVHTALTHRDITAGSYSRFTLPPYAFGSSEATAALRGKRHFYKEFISTVREILVSMGFEEMLGPYMEYEFWNFDALFVPQNHTAREEHDSYAVSSDVRLGPRPSREAALRVGRAHEKGWGYRWDAVAAGRLVLRSHTTAVSARRLAEKPTAPFKYFTIDRNFRRDAIDQTHLPDFDQCEGIVGGPSLTFRNLLGFLEALASSLGITKLRFKPSYFPFTEPSVEGYAYHGELGWIEVAPGGVFRPEVTRPLGIKFPVLAWGIGVTRLAMVYYGLTDIRELITQDLDAVVSKEEASAKVAHM